MSVETGQSQQSRELLVRSGSEDTLVGREQNPVDCACKERGVRSPNVLADRVQEVQRRKLRGRVGLLSRGERVVQEAR